MNLQQQLDELEALSSMYPEELTQNGTAGSLSGTVRLPDVLLEHQPVALRFQLPAAYPTDEPPQLSVECAASRSVHEQLSTVVREAAEAAVGSESLLLVLGVLQEAVAEAAAAAAGGGGATVAAGGSSQVGGPATTTATAHNPLAPSAAAAPAGGTLPDTTNTTTSNTTASAAAPPPPAECPNDVLQVIIWFHHIKSTQKRKHLVAWARELGCSGYTKPGFPGLCVVEGLVPDVREYIGRVRALQWQAMQVRGEQTVLCPACSKSAAGSNSTTPPDRAFGGEFSELPENGMSILGQACKAAGLEGLFRAALKL